MAKMTRTELRRIIREQMSPPESQLRGIPYSIVSTVQLGAAIGNFGPEEPFRRNGPEADSEDLEAIGRVLFNLPQYTRGKMTELTLLPTDGTYTRFNAHLGNANIDPNILNTNPINAGMGLIPVSILEKQGIYIMKP